MGFTTGEEALACWGRMSLFSAHMLLGPDGQEIRYYGVRNGRDKEMKARWASLVRGDIIGISAAVSPSVSESISLVATKTNVPQSSSLAPCRRPPLLLTVCFRCFVWCCPGWL